LDDSLDLYISQETSGIMLPRSLVSGDRPKSTETQKKM